MDKPYKRSNLTNSEFSNQEDYKVALDKDVKNLFQYTTTLPTSSGLPIGTITGDVSYWDNLLGWSILHPGLYGQVLMTRGDGFSPIWDWVWQVPGAQASSDKYIFVWVSEILSFKKIVMDKTINIGDSVDSTYSHSPNETQASASASDAEDIISMDQTSSNIHSITSEYSTGVA